MSRHLVIAAVACLAASSAAADGTELGRREFLAGCAQCHGLEGRGDGVIASYLTAPPPDLTALARANDGVFPVALVYEAIEAGGSVGAHGTSAMPAWGDRFAVDAYETLGWPHDEADRAAFVRARILALVEYVASIQTP